MRRYGSCGVLLGGVAAVALLSVSAQPASAAMSCADLASLKIAASEIGLPTTAPRSRPRKSQTVPADPAAPNGAKRDYCKVLGAIAPVDPQCAAGQFRSQPADAMERQGRPIWRRRLQRRADHRPGPVARCAPRHAGAGRARLRHLGHGFRPRQQEACRAAGVCAERRGADQHGATPPTRRRMMSACRIARRSTIAHRQRCISTAVRKAAAKR